MKNRECSIVNVLIYLSYDGTAYRGFQVQPEGPTIQEELEKALGLVYKQSVRLAGAGRTDSGVHARCQAASFEAPFAISLEKLPYALNSLLPQDIVVFGAAEVPPLFHARFSAIGKVYSYTLDRSRYPQVFLSRYSWHYPEPLNLEVMRQAASLFEGTYDYASYCASGSSVKDTVRTLTKVEVKENGDSDLLTFRFEGNGFLYRMVRLITGTLIRAGAGKVSLAAIEASLAGEESSAPGPTAPAHGLCLEKVLYPDLSLL